MCFRRWAKASHDPNERVVAAPEVQVSWQGEVVPGFERFADDPGLEHCPTHDVMVQVVWACDAPLMAQQPAAQEATRPTVNNFSQWHGEKR